MNLLKVLVPAVILKKLYGKKYKEESGSKPYTDEELDLIQDLKDDNS
ncbi:MAG TPA: hypothetical protein PJ984_03065 [Candidatus Saccharibacteria bacterium]|nr:hypothetical protein [Candidatus Woesebacteria bacterium]MDQ5913206.1 hypothetical protein [Patescibacteria group bacterium]HMS31350.1 hypothetical protein [Candidatus Saccharibacteria bacterium]